MNYVNIEKDNINNGSGLRVVLWISGCDKALCGDACKECFNTIAWKYEAGNKLSSGIVQTIIEELSKDYCSGLTITGGEPFSEGFRDEIENIISYIRLHMRDNQTIWAWSGYTYEELLSKKRNKMLSLIDVLVDGPFIKELKDETYSVSKWGGSSNQRTIDVKSSLKQKKVILL